MSITTLAPLTDSAVHALLQSPDVRAAAAASDELTRRMAARMDRYRAGMAAVRVYAVRSASGAVIGEAIRHGRADFTARPTDAIGASVPFDSHAAAVEWLRTLDYLTH